MCDAGRRRDIGAIERIVIVKAEIPVAIAQLTASIAFQAPDALRPHPRNARTHSKRQIKQVAESIRAFGHLVPVLVDEAGCVLAGHARLAAAKLLSLPVVPTIVAAGPQRASEARLHDRR
jgi:ParB-like chromosome segregation protein Spo0J